MSCCVDGTSPASESRSSSDFDTAMHYRRQCRREGRRHRPAQVHIHHRRGEGLRALHGEDHREGVQTRSRRLRRSPSVGVGDTLAPSVNVAAPGRGAEVSSAAVCVASTRRRTGNWTDAALYDVLDAVTDYGMKVNATSKKFGIPASSLRDHLLGKTRSRQ